MISTLLQAKWKILIALAALVTLRCVWLWQPERQVRLHQEHFLQAVQDRSWIKFSDFLDDSFHTPTGRDKKWTLQQSQMVLSQFIALEVDAADTTTSMEKDTATVRTLIRVKGKGLELAEMAKKAVNDSNDPFVFTWKHRSWKPWDWALISVEHPLLHRESEME